MIVSVPADGPVVYLISGPMAAGKSTVAQRLAERYERGVHLEGDVFRRFIVSGRQDMTPDAAAEAHEQLRLRYRLAASTADAYFEAGFTVVVEDVIAGPWLGEYRTMIRSRPCHVIVLLPSAETVATRESRRPTKGYSHWSVKELYHQFADKTPRVGIWLDNPDHTPEQTVDAILALTPSQQAPITVSDYDQSWPERFAELAAPVRAAVHDLGASVEHVGSTAVAGLAAKPIIDIDVVVPSGDDVPIAIDRLRGLGYLYQGDKGIPGREAFLWPPGATRHHLYVVVAGSKPHLDHTQFREHLGRHPEIARAYSDLKRDLATRFRDDPIGYTEAKSQFILAALASARPLGNSRYGS